MNKLRDKLARLIGRQADVTVVIPAVNEATTISNVITRAKASKRVAEVIVVDDGSVDETAAIADRCGARVVYSTHLGKGASMADGLREANSPIVIFLDADLEDIPEDTVDRLARPIEKGPAALVKGKFTRSQGRVTELVAKPLLRLFFPELSIVQQPLSGQMAIRREIGMTMRFENDYGVDVGLLIDTYMQGLKIVEVDLGRLDHRHHALPDLSGMAFEISQTILQRAEFYNRIDRESLRVMRSVHRQMEAAMETFARLSVNERTILLGLDGVLSSNCFMRLAADRFGFSREASTLLRDRGTAFDERTRSFGRLLAGASQEELAAIAGDMPLNDGAVEAVIDLRRLGYTVGVISDGFLVAAEVVRRRVFADFSLGNVLEYKRGRCTGNVSFAEAYSHPEGCRRHDFCKSNVIVHLRQRAGKPTDIVAVGSTAADACLLAHADLGLAFGSKDPECLKAAGHALSGHNLGEVVDYLAAADTGSTEKELVHRRGVLL